MPYILDLGLSLGFIVWVRAKVSFWVVVWGFLLMDHRS